MPGEPDPRYIIARRTLLDVLEALEVQRRAVIVVGAQAIYLHTGEADVALAPYTTDGDLVLDIDALIDEPTLGEIMDRARFQQGRPRLPERVAMIEQVDGNDLALQGHHGAVGVDRAHPGHDRLDLVVVPGEDVVQRLRGRGGVPLREVGVHLLPDLALARRGDPRARQVLGEPMRLQVPEPAPDRPAARGEAVGAVRPAAPLDTGHRHDRLRPAARDDREVHHAVLLRAPKL